MSSAICRVINDVEYEIPIEFFVEEYYHGTNKSDDPSYCAISEEVTVLEDAPPHWRKGDTLILTDDERHSLEQDEFNRHCEELEENYYESKWRDE